MALSISRLKIIRGHALGLMVLMLGVYAGPLYAATLDLEATVVTGETSIDFGNLRSLAPNGDPAADSAVRQVRLSVNSDLNRAYVITQIVQDVPVNPNGTALESEGLQFRVVVENGRGVVRTSDREPLRPGMQEIYLSDDNEAQTVLLVTYTLTPPPGQKAGRYHGTVTYRVDAR